MADNQVDMTERKRVDDGSKEGYAELEMVHRYTLPEGKARLYDEGGIHSFGRPLPTRLVRVQRCDPDKTLRYDYSPAEDAVKVLEPSDR